MDSPVPTPASPVLVDHEATPTFKYVNSLDREYRTEPEVSSVAFDISRYGEFYETIEFNVPVSERDAVAAAEAYLSEPLTKDYYEKIENDTFHRMTWIDVKKWYKTRGDCLGDAKFIERIDIEEGHMTFVIGS